jgi:hypothetical protein
MPYRYPAHSGSKVPICRTEAKFSNKGDADAKSVSLKSRVTKKSSPFYAASKPDGCAQVAQTKSQCLGFPNYTGPIKRQRLSQLEPTPLVRLQGTSQERSLLCWFQEYTANKVSGLFPSKFWSSLLPQASYCEPAVRHALLALTSAHKHEQLSILGRLATEEQFTLQAYCRAISHLKPHFSLSNNASLRVTLITCILFVWLEIVQRHYVTAISHFSSGLKLIEQYERSRGTIGTNGFLDNLESDDLIAQMFSRLSLQVNLLGYSSSYHALIGSWQQSDVLPDRFLSTKEARTHLDKLFIRVLIISDLCRKQELLQQAQGTLPAHQAVLQADLDSWLQALSASELETALKASPLRKAACIILRMYQTVAVIMVEACQFRNQETPFDQQWAYFLSITMYAVQARKVIADSQTAVVKKHLGDTHGTIFDIGWISALYYTSIKCRIRRIRLHAIRLLESTTHREGFWDAAIAAHVSREVMRIEEKDEPSPPIDDNFALDSIPGQDELLLPTLLESQRLHDVQVIFPYESHGKIGLKCRKRHDDNNWEDIWRERDPISEVWSDIL